MKITRKSPFSGREHTMDIPMLTPTLLKRIEDRTKPSQSIAPGLTADEREFLLTGITPTEWRETFGNYED